MACTGAWSRPAPSVAISSTSCPLPEGRVGIAVADVSGKGVPAALFMMSSRTLLHGAVLSHADPGDVLTAVNQQLHERNDAAMFVTVFLAVFDPATGDFIYANGGHNPPLVATADGATELPMTRRRPGHRAWRGLRVAGKSAWPPATSRCCTRTA